MNSSLCFSIASIFYIILIIIMYFSKERLKNKENKIYSLLLILSLVGLILEITSTIIYRNIIGYEEIKNFSLKLIMLYFVTWIYLLHIYVYAISKDKYNKKTFELIYIPFAIITLILPIYAKTNNNIILYSYGPCVNFGYTISVILILLSIILMFQNFKGEKKQKFVPLLTFIFFGIVISIIQYFNPSLLLTSSMETFTTVLMYFTIENPDVKMLEELYKNRKIIETSNEETSNFLFKITQDIKRPVNQIIEVSKDITDDKDLNEVREKAKLINNLSKELNFTINDELDISQMTLSHLKIYNTRYNPHNLFKEIIYKVEKEKDPNVKFESHITKKLPTYIYGDNIKLKQILNSVFTSSIENTKEGYISLDVDVIIKYEICRLIIKVSDTSKGLSIDEINDILSIKPSEKPLDTNKENFNLKEVRRLCTALGGKFMIKSDDKETTTTIVIEQKVAPTKETEIAHKLESYEQTITQNKKIMVVDDDAKELAEITTYLEKQGLNVNGSLFGRDIIDKYNNKMKYDLIILDDETSTFSALEVLNRLKQNKDFNTRTVVMIDDNKVPIKLEYLKDGFYDVIQKSRLKQDLDRIIKLI